MADTGLDERVCRKLGWEGTHWGMFVVGDKSYDCESHAPKGSIGEWKRFSEYPPVSSSWEWAGKALEEMIHRDWSTDLKTYVDDGSPMEWWCALVFGDGRPPFVGKATSGPLAIALAIDAALPELEP